MSQLQPRDNSERKISYDTLCICSHIASEHWVSDRKGNLFLSHCRECFANTLFLNGKQCTYFKQDNLSYLEKECKKRNI